MCHESPDLICHHDLPMILSENGERNTQSNVLCGCYYVSISGRKHLLFELILWADSFIIVLSWANHDRQIISRKLCLKTLFLHIGVKSALIL